MSSYVSTVTISDQEWMNIQRKISDTEIYVVRKREEAERLHVEANKRELELQKMREAANKAVDSAFQMLQGSYKQSLLDLGYEMKNDVLRNTDSFNGQIEALRKEVNENSRLTKQASIYVSNLSKEISQKLNALIASGEKASIQANTYIVNLEKIVCEIEKLNPDVFEPKTHWEISRLFEQVESNIESGCYQAALINSQYGIGKASELLTKLIVQNEMYDNNFIKALDEADNLKTKIDAFDSKAEGAIAFEIDGEKLEYEYDISHWSEGAFESIKAEFNHIYKQIIEAKEQRISIEALNAFIKAIEGLKIRLEECDINARKELLGSVQAQETAGRLCDSLLENNWELEEYGFDEDDDRNPYKMTYKDGSGNQIAIVVSPGVSAEKPDVFLEAFTEEEAHSEIIKNKIQSTLPDECVDVESTVHLNDCQNNSDTNSFIHNTIKKAKATNKARREKRFQ